MFGGDGWDILSALGDDDVLYGNTGLDTLESGTGDDLLYGGRDDDLLRGGTACDTLFGGANSEPVYVLRYGVAVLLDGRDTPSGDPCVAAPSRHQSPHLLDGGAPPSTE